MEGHFGKEAQILYYLKSAPGAANRGKGAPRGIWPKSPAVGGRPEIIISHGKQISNDKFSSPRVKVLLFFRASFLLLLLLPAAWGPSLRPTALLEPCPPPPVSLPKWPSKEKTSQIKDKIPNYLCGGNFAAPGADFR